MELIPLDSVPTKEQMRTLYRDAAVLINTGREEAARVLFGVEFGPFADTFLAAIHAALCGPPFRPFGEALDDPDVWNRLKGEILRRAADREYMGVFYVEE